MSKNILNFNVGLLGHIDSGKTSLSKALSTIASTASFDKNPQSQERGITIDLGFSSFTIDAPDHIRKTNPEYEILQFTLVDCPGHASLIRTIIGGAQIIDLILLIVDITKGMQTQTAECLVLGEITCDHMIVVLNKIDLLPPDKVEQSIQKMSKKILKTLEKTKFKNSDIIPVSANPSNLKPISIDVLVKTLQQHSYIPERSEKGQFVFAVDHCFPIKGQGTVMTGTVIQGSIILSDSIEIPSAKIVRKVKSIQMYKQPIAKAIQGDRVGICVTQFDSKILERGTVCAPGYMETVDVIIVSIYKIPYFKGKCLTNSKFHISIMHDTVMAKCAFFCSLKSNQNNLGNENEFNYNDDYSYLEEIPENELSDFSEPKLIFAVLQFDKPVILSQNSTYIASKLETDIHANICRLAFHGKILSMISSKVNTEGLSRLKVFKEKSRDGIVDRIVNEHQVIVRDLFKKETNIQIFTNLKVVLSSGEVGLIEGSFGQSGKVNVRIPNGLCAETVSVLNAKKSKKDAPKEKPLEIKVTLKFKKYIYDSKKKISQS